MRGPFAAWTTGCADAPTARGPGQGAAGHAPGPACCPKGRSAVPRRLPLGGWSGARCGRTIARMIHDVDQLLEKLVKKDALNSSSVELVFEAPTKDWVARRSGPAVDLYLYDIREDLERRVPAWEDV